MESVLHYFTDEKSVMNKIHTNYNIQGKYTGVIFPRPI